MRSGRRLEATRWWLPGTPGPRRSRERPWAPPRLSEGNTAASIEPCQSRLSREKKETDSPGDVGGDGPAQPRHYERR
ncbi:hypothetical protein NDU88_000368 [Pleurodeles waltl]|uniref:Uncharacterized protein n=1 Tax=Pleurodeles waltl TaxID=8319 RepID=A0AAV7TEX1_PLEWA|nr:hypothetical protein NDU88_000368 [Pleurodeles waltl]